MRYPIIFTILGLGLLLTSCEKDNAKTVTAPLTYEFLRGGETTVSFSGQTTRIAMATELNSALVDKDKSAEQLIEMYSNMTVDGEDANPFNDTDLNNSTKSIKSKVAASADFFSMNTVESSKIKADIESWIIKQVSEVFPQSNQLAAAGVFGQIADGSTPRYVNGKGLEYNQAVNKSLIGALMVDQISNNYLSTAVLDAGTQLEENNDEVLKEGKSYTTMEHKWDEAYGYLFGASANPAQPLLTLGDDSFLNKYLDRVDSDEDFAGIALEVYNAFKLGRAAIVEHDYELRDQQAELIKKRLAEVIAIRAVHYLQIGKIALAAGDYGGAFHDLSEGFGFIYSLKFVKRPGSTQALYTSDEIDGFLNQLMEGNGFWDVTDVTLDSLSEEISSHFDFTVSQTL